MIIQNLLFFAFSGLLIFSALMVVALQRPVQCALFLVVCFFAATGLWLLLTAEFLALVLILVYVGAVMTLFLFVVMTLNMDIATLKNQYLKYYLPIGLIITALLAALLTYVLHHVHLSSSLISSADFSITHISNTRQLGDVLYTQYALPFEIAAVILLVAMIAAISLTLSEPIRRKQQSIDEQIRVNAKDRVRLVK